MERKTVSCGLGCRGPSWDGSVTKATEELYEPGQSLWLDNIIGDPLDSRAIQDYRELSVTGITSHPTIFECAFKKSTVYAAAIKRSAIEGKASEDIVFEVALEKLTRAADLFRPIYEQTGSVDGWVSLEVSALLTHDVDKALAAAQELFARAA